MKKFTPLQKHERISPEHKKVLSYVWKIHHELKNNASCDTLRSLVKTLWEQALKNHLLDEEISVSAMLKSNDKITDSFFRFHMEIRKKISRALEQEGDELKENLEDICALLIEMIKFEETKLKPFMHFNFAMQL